MKTTYASLVVAAIIQSTCNAEFRDFTDQQGRTVTGKLIAFNKRTGKVTLQQKGGQTASVLPTVFSPEDQLYVTDWIYIYRSTNANNYSMSVKEIRPKELEEKTDVHRANIRYSIQLKSMLGFKPGDIHCEYCVFIERKAYGKYQDSSFCEVGEITYPNQKEGEAISFTTETIPLDQNASFIYGEKKYQDSIKGIIFRIYPAPQRDVFFEFSEPKGFSNKHEWLEFPKREEKSGWEFMSK